jgi:hypothetical protein
MAMFELTLGDLQIIGENASPPVKLIKALAVIADRLHPSFDAHPRVEKNKSKESCVLCALTVRDFLRTIGFAARVEPVCFIGMAERNGTLLHSAGIGMRGPIEKIGGRWNGHLITIVRDSGWLIDTTLYQVQRPAWPHLPGMIAISLDEIGYRKERFEYQGMPALAAIHTHDPDDGDYRFDAGWLLNPGNKLWRNGPDGRNAALRAPIIGELVERFGGWQEAAA